MEVKILFENDAREALYKGVLELTTAVASTLGPKGHTVIIDKGYGIPHVTKDGVTVARAYDTDDPVKRMGATLVKTVAAKTCDEAGDGTTTATILAEALIRIGMAKLPNVTNPQQFKAGIEEAAEIACDYIENKAAIKIQKDEFDRIKQIAVISANGDKEVGAIITEAIGKVGDDGVITVEESSKGDETSVEVTTGFQYEKGLINPYFVTDPERMECVLDRPYILVFGQNINYVQEILPIVQTVYAAKRSLLIIAPNMTNDVVKFLIMNVQQTNGLKACFVKAPGYGQMQKDLLGDLAIKMGAKVIGDEYGHPIDQAISAATEWLGECDRVVVTTTRTVLVGGAGTEGDINTRVEAIKHLMDANTNAYDLEKYRERISKLTGGAAVVYVGAKSEVELKERKDRVDDAIAATRAAIEEGYVAGAGITHYRASKAISTYLQLNGSIDPNFIAGAETVQMALEAPFRQLCTNSGYKPDKIEALLPNEIGKENYGFNPITGKIENMLNSGIIDPAKVARVTLVNSVSVAIQFLNTSCAMAAEPENTNKK